MLLAGCGILFITEVLEADMDRSRFKDYSSKNHNDWVDWLSSDPPTPSAKQTLRQARVNNATAYQTRSAQPAATSGASAPKPDLTININLQKIKLPRPKLPKVSLSRLLPSRKVAAALTMVLVISAAAYLFLAHGPRGGTAAASDTQVARSSPSFQPVAPVTKPQLGDFASHVTAYDGRRDTYSYADSISGNRITISEQPAPKNLGSTEQMLQKIASQTGASDKIDTTNGQAFIRTSQETGAQTVVCSVDGLLVFINSSTKFQDADWVKYISDLQ